MNAGRKERWITFILCGLFILLAGVMYLLRGAGNKEGAELLSAVSAQGQPTAGQTGGAEGDGESPLLPAPEENEAAAGQIQERTTEAAVYICGAVKKPGVYHFSEKARVWDAIQWAGGLTGTAAGESVNQARYLTDGEQIRIPTRKEQKASGGKREKPGQDRPAGSHSGQTGDLVNINEADGKELTALPGIGEARAEQIITYRKKNGFFQRKEDIMKISGIKEGIYEKIKDAITV